MFEDFRAELEAHEREERRTQVALFRALTDSERLEAALAFHRSVRRMSPPAALEGTIIDRDREAAKVRIEEGMGPPS